MAKQAQIASEIHNSKILYQKIKYFAGTNTKQFYKESFDTANETVLQKNSESSKMKKKILTHTLVQ